MAKSQGQMKNFLKLLAYEMRKTRHRHCLVERLRVSMQMNTQTLLMSLIHGFCKDYKVLKCEY